MLFLGTCGFRGFLQLWFPTKNIPINTWINWSIRLYFVLLPVLIRPSCIYQRACTLDYWTGNTRDQCLSGHWSAAVDKWKIAIFYLKDYSHRLLGYCSDLLDDICSYFEQPTFSQTQEVGNVGLFTAFEENIDVLEIESSWTYMQK